MASTEKAPLRNGPTSIWVHFYNRKIGMAQTCRVFSKRCVASVLARSNGLYNAPLPESFNSSPPGQNGRHFADDIFICIFLNEHFSIFISMRFVPKVLINNLSALVQVMARCCQATNYYLKQWWPNLLTHISGIRGIWVNHPRSQR